MKIGVVTPYFYPAWEYGGTPRAAFELARALAARGHELRVLTTGSKTETKTVHGIRILYYRNLSSGLAFEHRLFLPLGFRPGLRQELRSCDILHIHEFRSTLTGPAVRIARPMSIPYVLSPHGGLQHLGKRVAKTIFDLIWGRSILENAAAIPVLTEKEKHDAVQFGARESRVHRLPNAIDAEAYTDLPARTTSRKTILFLGRLNRIKGVDVLLKAFEGLQGVQLVLAGPDDGDGARIPPDANILKMGFLDHDAKLQALVNSDIVVLRTADEGPGKVWNSSIQVYGGRRSAGKAAFRPHKQAFE